MKINLDRPICFFDLETTGAKVGKDRIVEIAILKVDVDKSESQKVWRINPEMEISFQATNVHGITNEMVKDEPNFKHYAKEIYEFIKGCDHNSFCLVYDDNISLNDSIIEAGEFMRIEKPVELPDEWIDEIPVAPSLLKARLVCVASVMLLGLGC